MAKRKAARATGRKKSSKRAKARPARRVRAVARRKAPARRVARRTALPKKARKTASHKATARKAPARKAPARKATAPRAVARKATERRAPAVARKVPALNRERRIVRDEDIVPTPPSSLDLDRSASAARSGRRELSEKLHDHTETSPAITGGDIDADWESAYSVGDEAPGGDNPTPDQDIVDDIGKALGVQYEDNEELKGEKKISDRDKKRWELDPASAEDYEDR
jgi:hypothetical protein